MKKNVERLYQLWANKWYVSAISFTALCGYGFFVTHQTVGIDDTPYLYYFEEGLNVVVGRWFLFLLNKVIHIAEFVPFITDLCGVMILMSASSVWCVLFCRIFGDHIPVIGAILFSCLFISNPLISEVFTYYLHNGVATGYLASGIALCCFWEGLSSWQNEKQKKKKAVMQWCGSALMLWIALGCYESFMIVYLVGVCVMLCSAHVCGKGKGFVPPTGVSLVSAAMIGILSILLRTLMISAVIKCFHLEYLQGEAVQRSITEMISWITEPGAFSEFAMIVKRIFVMYGVFAYAYYPIRIYVFVGSFSFILCLLWSIRRRDAWVVVFFLGSLAASFLLILIEGKATYYRSAQFLPVFSAWGILLGIFTISRVRFRRNGKGNKIILGICYAILCVILWNQCVDLNKWFYVDWMKYEEARSTVERIDYEIKSNYDSSKPVVFTGVYEVPRSIIQDAYVSYGDVRYYKMLRITSLIDEHLLEKFYRDYGVWVAQTPALSVIDWGRYAFGTDEELVRFMAMHGYEIRPLLDASLYQDAEELSADWPSFPTEGSIADMGEYIIVHF